MSFYRGISNSSEEESEAYGTKKACEPYLYRQRGSEFPPSLLFGFLLLVFLLLWLAGRRNWGPGGENVPYLGAIVVLLGILPAIRWKLLRSHVPEQVGMIPFVPVLGVLYALYFGMPVLLEDGFQVPTLQHDIDSVAHALKLSIIGWFALLLGCGLNRVVFPEIRPVDLRIDWARAKALLPVFLVVGFLAILAQRELSLPGALAQPVRFLQMLFQLGVGVLILLSLRGDLEKRESRLLWLGLVPAYLFLQVGHGSVAQLAYAGIFIMFLVWGIGKRVPLLALGLAGMVVLLMRGHVHAFRGEAWQEGGAVSDASPWSRSVFFLELLFERFSEDTGGAFEEAVEQVSARVAHLGVFAHVTALTPERVPHWGGTTYAALPSTFIPRLLWPNKPSKEIGQAFGHRYELLAPTDRSTAVNLPIPVEFYANFGALGLALGMLLLGLIYAALSRLWNHPQGGEGAIILGSILFSRLILIESDFTLVFGAVLQTSVLLILVLRALRPADSDRSMLVAGGLR